MAQYDVYRRPSSAHLLLDVQSRLLDELLTRACIPLQLKTAFLKPAPHLNPEFELEGLSYVLMTHYIVSVPARDLRSPIANLKNDDIKITRALDMLYHGF
ncbi:CcdB family protein [Rhizobium sp. KVB221]|uniref:Toxin CcdB n=1 Tax=Rhizobium setariae TaxID=2801340 RepID=A0A936YJ13_9HYPH|nr:CcdB family protein [Rhizobium setariae]MBL0371204.1 CcdB family protein [Rhizobium setariae]